MLLAMTLIGSSLKTLFPIVRTELSEISKTYFVFFSLNNARTYNFYK
jgi:hypothetical protein